MLWGKDCSIDIEVVLWPYEEVYYSRDFAKWQYERIGEIVVNEGVLDKLATAGDLLNVFNNKALYSYRDHNSIDIDEAMEFFLKVHGEDFVPDENEAWYILPEGNGLCGEKVVSYLEAYKEDQWERGNFVRGLETFWEHLLDYVLIELKVEGRKEKIVYEREYAVKKG